MTSGERPSWEPLCKTDWSWNRQQTISRRHNELRQKGVANLSDAELGELAVLSGLYEGSTGRVTIDQAHFNGRRLYFNRSGKDSRKTAALRDKAVVESKQFVDAAWARIIRGDYYPD